MNTKHLSLATIALSLVVLSSCTTAYRIHLKVTPPDQYDVVLNDTLRCKTPPSGDTTITTGPVSVYSAPLLEVKKDSLYGKIKMNSNDEPRDMVNVVSFKNIYQGSLLHNYQVIFNLDTTAFVATAPIEEPRKESEVDLPRIYKEQPQAPLSQTIGSEPRTQPDSTIANIQDAEDTLSPTKSGVQTKTTGGTRHIVIGNASIGKGADKFERLSIARKQAVKGATLYFVGLGLSYGVMLPLQLNVQLTPETALLMMIPLLVIDAFKVAGPIIAGVGASKAEDYAVNDYYQPQTSSSYWGFCKAGWACKAGASALGVVNTLSSTSYSSTGDTSSQVSSSNAGISVAMLVLDVATDVFWSISCIKSLVHANDITRKLEDHNVSLVPTYDLYGKAGLNLVCTY